MAVTKDANRPPKQAVVIIHGMGEPRPMGTLRAFVRSVWEHVDWPSQIRRDRGEDVPAAAPLETRNQWWVKPDRLTGMHELRRITTGGIGANRCERAGAEQGCDDAACPQCRLRERRTDFFEFYWADLMQGTTRAHVMSWVRGLMLRAPLSVPRRVLPVWLFLWLLFLLAATTFVTGMLEAAGAATACIGTRGAPSAALECWPFLVAFWTKSAFGLLAIGAVIAAAAYLGHLGLKGVRILCTRQGRRRNAGRIEASFVLALAFIAIWAGFAARLLDGTGDVIALLRSPAFNMFTAAAFAALLYALNAVLKAYFGDVARYVEASPSNVQARRAIRDRGLGLLGELHDCGRYDRIVIVGHSLGSIVAYDLLNLLWAQRGPSPSRPHSDRSREALEEHDAMLAQVLAEKVVPPGFGQALRASQRRVGRALAADAFTDPQTSARRPFWLISDFVTLGSPLTHAEFLLSRDEKGLAEAMRERSLPTCPPVLERDARAAPPVHSFHYEASPDTAGATRYPHHATCFAATRWTNIHDSAWRWFFLQGDIISGPVGERFGGAVRGVATAHGPGQEFRLERDGRALRDIAVAVRPGFCRWLPRLFTHTSYWSWRNGFARAVPPHIQHLRDALRLGED